MVVPLSKFTIKYLDVEQWTALIVTKKQANT
jgi:hypothetical protein